jgi:16S rRNA (cytosine967-C5)-methyltransferase
MSARSTAAQVLVAVSGASPLDAALAEANKDGGILASLEERDRSFARLLALTVLRRRGQIDDVLGALLDHPLASQRPRERELLRIGVAQILFLGTPAHAAVHATVEAAAPSRRRLLNAVLRRATREGPERLATQDPARLNTPAWLWDMLIADTGEKLARAICAVHAAEPPLDVSVREDGARWAAELGADVLPTGSLRIRGAGPVARLAGYADGAWWVQDAAAALPAKLLLGALPRTAAECVVADLCAAPGGKTSQLAASGARTFAVDSSAPRLATLRANLARLDLAAEVVAADATDWHPPTPLDAVLLDAPCSATGTVRRHPDIPWRKNAANAVALAPAQDRLLDAAAAMLRPGGVLVYCVCSLDRREGEARAQAFLGRHFEFERVPVRVEEIGGLTECISPAGDLRTLPCHLDGHGGMDGFFALRARRVA